MELIEFNDKMVAATGKSKAAFDMLTSEVDELIALMRVGSELAASTPAEISAAAALRNGEFDIFLQMAEGSQDLADKLKYLQRAVVEHRRQLAIHGVKKKQPDVVKTTALRTTV